MGQKTIDVLSVGLVVCDIIAKPVGRSVFDIDSSKIDTLKVASGGDALNAAVNMAKLGLKVGLVGKTGSDMMGNFLADEAARSGIDVSGMIKSDEFATSTSLVLVEENGERHFAYYGKTNNTLSIGDISDEMLEKAKIVHLGSAMALDGLDHGNLAELFKRAHEAGAMTSMDVTWDATGEWLGKIEEALYHTDIFMPSQQEAQLISGKETPEEMAEFYEKFGIKILVIKLGEKGCFVTDFKESRYIKAFTDVDAVDTTGAGDAFVSGFLAGTVQGMSLHDRAVFGSATAAAAVTGIGATTATKGWDENMAFIRSHEEYRDFCL